ncbi:hypothetical protein WMF04_15495 [Sorangium sp. So ce260]|uniref:hypothetical protein n=1 Tax=Sorangium sp. So ce260 TaxID=3133291 RepID=UPI003F61E44E
MWKVWRQDRTWRISLAIGALGMASACSGDVAVDRPGGSGGSGGVGGAGAGGGGAEPGLYDAFCDTQAACKAESGPSYDTAACKASAQCDSTLLHHPGGPLFDCLADSCSPNLCLTTVYLDYLDYSRVEHTEAAKEFEERCGTGCPVFEDFCMAGALFTDEALETMTKCFDLPSCEQVKSCALETYAPCTAWLYQISP